MFDKFATRLLTDTLSIDLTNRMNYFIVLMKWRHLVFGVVFTLASFFGRSQESLLDSLQLERSRMDSTYIQRTEGTKGRDKVLHAEPLYIDLIRDLGARKGEKEWNVGFGLTDNQKYDQYTALVEYEFAPIDRLGLEVELPFSFYFPVNGLVDRQVVPQNKLNGLKLAAQYSFFVSERISTSMALGYIHEFAFVEFNRYGKQRIWKGSIYNPFLIAAKRWGRNFHTLVYSGPVLTRSASSQQSQWQTNTSLHFMIPGTRNFIGLEMNKETVKGGMDMVFRPQMRLEITEKLMMGIVTGVPINRENERFSMFMRIIYEPGHNVRQVRATPKEI